MKKFLFLIILLAAAAVGLIATCPDRNAHQEAIKSVVSEVLLTTKWVNRVTSLLQNWLPSAPC